MDDVQSWWEVPSIAYFCSLFRSQLNLTQFDIQDLEEALLIDGVDESGSCLLPEIIISLLAGCLGQSPKNTVVTRLNYEIFLRRFLSKKCQEGLQENPFKYDIEFQFLPVRTKVKIIQALCDFRLGAEDAQYLLEDCDSDMLRVNPLGHDANASVYYYFYGTRLYKEDLPKYANKTRSKLKRRNLQQERVHSLTVKEAAAAKAAEKEEDAGEAVEQAENAGEAAVPAEDAGEAAEQADAVEDAEQAEDAGKAAEQADTEQTDAVEDAEQADDSEEYDNDGGLQQTGTWQVICYTQEDWEKLTTRFKVSPVKEEKALAKVLEEYFLPKISRLFAEKRKILEFVPRTSSRIEKRAKQREEENKILAQEEKERHEKERQEKERQEKERKAKEAEAMEMAKKAEDSASQRHQRYLSRSRILSSRSDSVSTHSSSRSYSDDRSGIDGGTGTSERVDGQTDVSASPATDKLRVVCTRLKLLGSQIPGKTEERQSPVPYFPPYRYH